MTLAWALGLYLQPVRNMRAVPTCMLSWRRMHQWWYYAPGRVAAVRLSFQWTLPRALKVDVRD